MTPRITGPTGSPHGPPAPPAQGHRQRQPRCHRTPPGPPATQWERAFLSTVGRTKWLIPPGDQPAQAPLDGQLAHDRPGLEHRLRRRKCLSTVSEGPCPVRQGEDTHGRCPRPIAATRTTRPQSPSPHLTCLTCTTPRIAPSTPGPLPAHTTRCGRQHDGHTPNSRRSGDAVGSQPRGFRRRKCLSTVSWHKQPKGPAHGIGHRKCLSTVSWFAPQGDQGQGKEKPPRPRPKGSGHHGLSERSAGSGPTGIRSRRRTPRSRGTG